jgi:integrase
MATVRRRNGKYQVQVRINGYVRSKTFPNHDLAKKWANKQEIIAFTEPDERPRYVPRNFSEILDKYWIYAQKHHKGAPNEKIVINALQREHWVKKPLGELKRQDVIEYRDQRLAQVKPSTFKRQLNIIKSAARRAAEDWNWHVDNKIFENLRLPKQDERPISRISPLIEEALISAAAKSKSQLMRLMIEIAIDTGLRKGELLQLKEKDIDTLRRLVCVANTKNGKCRWVPLTERSATNFQELMGGGSSNLLPITTNASRIAFERIRAKAGYQWVRFHDLRHEAISRWFELGLTIPEIMQISGHSDSNVLMRYAHANNERLSKIISR